ncbi:MAG: hypothetical protein COT74_10905 [Bdellovibrionales bacterium CG10_big_fil_rev_8_21_14_0_10_45_34]|nr:MAG: hypothetical protein COT74_10905 [Bdellovibrionales bacterium CG10_big_fil_rev_8_21_14_0_10_45_34]
MYLPDCKIKFVGVRVPKEVRRSIEKLVAVTKNSVPSDSSLCLRLVRGPKELAGSAVTGILSVVSLSSRFEARASGLEPMQVVNSVNKELMKQVKRWIRHRDFNSVAP